MSPVLAKPFTLSRSATLFALLFCQQNLSKSRSLWLFFTGSLLNQESSSRLFYFNFLCLLEFNSRIYISLKYYFVKYIQAFFHRLAFFRHQYRVLLLHLEYLRRGVPEQAFSLDFFCYQRDNFYLPLILPFNRYFLRLDIYSFFFLWSAAEALRISFYNRYIQAHPDLRERPFLRHCFVQAWFPRRRAYLSLRGLPVLHLRAFERGSLRQRLSERFSIMLFHRKYIVLNLLQFRTHLFRQVTFPIAFNFLLKNDATLHWLSSLSGTPFSMFGLFAPWDWAQLCRIFFLYFMSYPKRYALDRWRLTRYFKYFTRSLIEAYFTSEYFITRSVRTYSSRFTQRFYRQLFSSLQHAFFLQDLYHYHSFSWEAFASFIDRRFCYRVLSMKFNWFFDNYFLKEHASYMGVTFSLLRPFPRKPTPNQLVPRRRAFFFAKRFLLRFCVLPLFFSFTLLGLEYFYWRIYEYTSSTRWLDDQLPLVYYYLKLDIDRLLLSRYRSLVGFLKTSTVPSFPSLYDHSHYFYMYRNSPIFHRKRWALKVRCDHLNPWILLHFTALKSIFLQSFNRTLPLTLLAFYLFQSNSLSSIQRRWAQSFYFRTLVLVKNSQKIHHFLLADQKTFIHLKVDWLAPRAKKWLAPFDVENLSNIRIESRYAASYGWLRENKQKIPD